MTVEPIVPGDAKAVEGLWETGDVELLDPARGLWLPQPGLPQGHRRRCSFILLPMRIRRGWIAPPAMQADLLPQRRRIRRLRRRASAGLLLRLRQDRRCRSIPTVPVPGLVGYLYRDARPQICQGSAPAAAGRSHRYRASAVRAVTRRAHAANPASSPSHPPRRSPCALLSPVTLRKLRRLREFSRPLRYTRWLN